MYYADPSHSGNVTQQDLTNQISEENSILTALQGMSTQNNPFVKTETREIQQDLNVSTFLQNNFSTLSAVGGSSATGPATINYNDVWTVAQLGSNPLQLTAQDVATEVADQASAPSSG